MAIIKTPGEAKSLQSGLGGRQSKPPWSNSSRGQLYWPTRQVGLHGSVGRTRESAHAREAGLRRFASYEQWKNLQGDFERHQLDSHILKHIPSMEHEGSEDKEASFS